MKNLKRKIRPGRSLLIALFSLAGLGLLAYPVIGRCWNRRIQSRAVADYSAAVKKEKDFSTEIALANEYNRITAMLGSARTLAMPALLEDFGFAYEELLDITGTGIMGTIEIPKIDLCLPIYHGSSAEVLREGAGHLEGSSLPVGGKSTHCVILGHRGMPSAELFTALDKLEEGDLFTIRVLNEELNYQVDQILVVKPDEFEELYVLEGRDLCTLMTCTPYGINSHRLLVRGRRTENAEVSVENKGNLLLLLILLLVVGTVTGILIHTGKSK